MVTLPPTPRSVAIAARREEQRAAHTSRQSRRGHPPFRHGTAKERARYECQGFGVLGAPAPRQLGATRGDCSGVTAAAALLLRTRPDQPAQRHRRSAGGRWGPWPFPPRQLFDPTQPTQSSPAHIPVASVPLGRVSVPPPVGIGGASLSARPLPPAPPPHLSHRFHDTAFLTNWRCLGFAVTRSTRSGGRQTATEPSVPTPLRAECTAARPNGTAAQQPAARGPPPCQHRTYRAQRLEFAVALSLKSIYRLRIRAK